MGRSDLSDRLGKEHSRQGEQPEDPGAERSMVSSVSESDLVAVLGEFLVTAYTSRPTVTMDFGSSPERHQC